MIAHAAATVVFGLGALFSMIDASWSITINTFLLILLALINARGAREQRKAREASERAVELVESDRDSTPRNRRASDPEAGAV